MKKLKFFEGVKRERASDPEEKAFPSAVEIMNYTPPAGISTPPNGQAS